MIKYSLLNSRKQLHAQIETHTVAFLHAENVFGFIEPPNSPGLNPVDYSIFGAPQQLLYWEKIADIDRLLDHVQSRTDHWCN